MKPIKLRNDDFDGRWWLDIVKTTHELFLKHGLEETISIQPCLHGAMGHRDDIITYVKNTPGYRIAMHGFDHEPITNVSTRNLIKEIAANKWFIKEWYGVEPMEFYTPWNGWSIELENACKYMKVYTPKKSMCIKQFIREYPDGIEGVESVYFHMWDKKLMSNLDKFLKFYELLQQPEITDDRLVRYKDELQREGILK